MEIKGMVQGSEIWHKFRLDHLGASDSVTIMGLGWITPYKLWKQKMGIDKEQFNNFAMQRGTDMEPIARAAFSELMGYEVTPSVYVSDDVPYMSASLDGIDFSGKRAVEIKCPGSKDHALAVSGQVPPKYYPQLQHQMFVCGLSEINYYSFDGRNGVNIVVKRDPDYLLTLLGKEAEFYSYMQNLEFPGHGTQDQEWHEAMTEYFTWKAVKDEAEEKMEECKKIIIDRSNRQDASGFGYTLKKAVRKGAIGYDVIPQLEGVDLENFRKPGTEYFTLSMDRAKGINHG